MIKQGAPIEDIVATVYKDTGANVLYVEPLPPQQSLPLPPLGEVGYPVARVWYGLANITPSSKPTPSGRRGGPSSVEDMFVTGGADFTRSPLPISRRPIGASCSVNAARYQ